MKTCPACNKEFDPEKVTDDLPFCSERCRLMDLGAWLTEKHRILDDSFSHSDTLPGEIQDEKKH
jgi:endogenous inhibitor of DNA gyrase (YacG/DUF329 family)